MRALPPRTILVAGPLTMFLVAFVPAALLLDGQFALYGAMAFATLMAAFLGLPLFSLIAWGSYWTIYKPQGNPYQLDRWYRYVERNLAIVAMGAIGFIAGTAMTAMAFTMDGDNGGRMGIAVLILVVVGLASIALFACIKIGLVQRLEFLQIEINRLEQSNEAAEPPQ